MAQGPDQGRADSSKPARLEVVGPSGTTDDPAVAIVEVLAGGGVRVAAEGVRYALNRREAQPDWKTDPLVVRVLGVVSVAEEGRHAIRIDVENRSPHGVYVEGVRVGAPKVTDTTVRTLRVNGTMFSPTMGAASRDAPPALPVLLPRNAHLALVVTFPHLPTATLKKKRAGELHVVFSASGSPDADSPVEVPFLIRADANGAVSPRAAADIDVS